MAGDSSGWESNSVSSVDSAVEMSGLLSARTLGKRPMTNANTSRRAKRRLWIFTFVWNNSFPGGSTPQMCRQPTADLLRRKFVIFSCHTQSMPAKNCLFRRKVSGWMLAANLCGAALNEKGPCIQSINDGRRGLGDNLYDQHNAVIFSKNAKKAQPEHSFRLGFERWY